MMKNKTIVCKNCGLVSDKPKTEDIPLPTGGFHRKAICPGCRKFIKFLPHNVPTLYFGKHKGESIAEVARVDLPYLRWMDSMDIATGRVKAAIREVLACRK